MIWEEKKILFVLLLAFHSMSIVKQIDTFITASALGSVELINIMAIAGIIISVFLVHPSNCVCYTSLWGKKGVIIVIFTI